MERTDTAPSLETKKDKQNKEEGEDFNAHPRSSDDDNGIESSSLSPAKSSSSQKCGPHRDCGVAASSNNANDKESPSSFPSSPSRYLYKGEALAPMVRASTTPLRTLALKYGADFVYTDELVDRSIAETIRVENHKLGTIDYIKDKSKLSKKTQRRMDREGNETALILRIDPKVESGRLVCQLGSGEPELALRAALHVHRDVQAIDINMGCPRKFSVSGGMGSALLTDPDRTQRIFRTLSTNLPQHIPVSGKIRLIKAENPNATIQRTVDFITGLIEAGASAVAVHGRRPGDQEVEAADWDSLAEVVALSKSKYPAVPILVNGDFYTRQEFTDFQKKTGADGVLLARPALFNTSIFRKPPPGDSTTTIYSYKSPLLLDKTTVIQDYIREATRYNVHFKNTKYVICEMMNNRRAPYARVPCLVQHFPGKQTIGLTSACHNMDEICKVWNVAKYEHSGKPHEFDTALVPGDHRYDDSYLRKMEPEDEIDAAPQPKKTRLQ